MTCPYNVLTAEKQLHERYDTSLILLHKNIVLLLLTYTSEQDFSAMLCLSQVLVPRRNALTTRSRLLLVLCQHCTITTLHLQNLFKYEHKRIHIHSFGNKQLVTYVRVSIPYGQCSHLEQNTTYFKALSLLSALGTNIFIN